MDMVERVARTLCKADGKDPDAACKISTCGGEMAMKEWQYHYPFAAIRAIETMREPDDRMIEVCRFMEDQPVQLTYTAMIEAALKKTPAG